SMAATTRQAGRAGKKAATAIRAFALGFPAAYEDFPWGERVVCFRGTASAHDLALFQSNGAKGMHHCPFELPNEDDFAAASAKLEAAGVKVEFEVYNAAKKAMFLKDPSGTYIEIYHPRKLDFAAATTADADRWVFLV
ncbi:MAG: hypothetical protein FJX61_02325, partial [Alphaproteobacteria bacterium]|nr:hypothetical protein [Alphaproteobacteria bacterium]